MTFFLIILYIFVGKCQKNGEVGMAAGIIAIVTGKYRVCNKRLNDTKPTCKKIYIYIYVAVELYVLAINIVPEDLQQQ
jgi:hypothetical protein